MSSTGGDEDRLDSSAASRGRDRSGRTRASGEPGLFAADAGWLPAQPTGEEQVQALAGAIETGHRELARVNAELARLAIIPGPALSPLRRVRLRVLPAGSARERVARRGFFFALATGRWVSRLLRRAADQDANALPPSASEPAQPYDLWFRGREPDASQLVLQRRVARTLRRRPLISVVCPVFAPPADVLAETINSVRGQTYDNWELILVKAGPQPAAVSDCLRSWDSEPRIVVLDLDQNLGIAGNNNKGVAVAKGEYVAFLDHDDLFTPDALYEVVRLFNADPAADLVYFDEDKISADGLTPCDPYFKPDWSPEHLLSINYLMHSVYRRSAIEGAGGFDSRYDGAQDWDLALRLAERGIRARHIPRVLYHWRMLPGSAASDANAKPWAMAVQAPCIKAHLERRGFAGVEVETPASGVLRPTWKGLGSRVSIIIPTRDRSAMVRTCLTSILTGTEYPDYEILLVDTGSVEPETARMYDGLAAEPRVRLVRFEGDFNFSGVNNWAAAQASGDVLLFLNNDIEVLDPGWLDELARWAELGEIGCVGAKLLYPDGTIQHAGLVMGMEGHASQLFRREAGAHHWSCFGSPDFYRNHLALTAACLAVRRDVFRAVGGFDEEYRLCYNDIDLCLRVAAAGYRNLYTPFARLTHHEGASRGLTFPPADVLRASIQMFPIAVQGDPSYNPALSYASLSPRVAEEDGPGSRAARIARITRVFGVHEAWDRAIDAEMRGETRAWERYRPLTRRDRPVLDAAGDADQLRVLMATHDLSRSGAPMVLVHLAEYLHNLGQQVTVVSANDGPLREEFEARGAHVITCPTMLAAPYVLGDLFASHTAVIANTILCWRFVISATSAGIPSVWLIHESDFGRDFARAHPSIARAFVSASRVIFPSRETRDRYREFDGGNQAVVHYGINPVAASADAFVKVPGRFYVIVVASIEPRKGQDVLIAAIEKLPDRVRGQVDVFCLGRSIEHEYYRDVRASADRVGGVYFLSHMSNAETMRFMATCDVLVCCSRDDPSPVVVFEAMALGVPVVSTRVGAIAEIISDGESGVLIDREDADALAAAIVRLYDHRELASRLGTAGRAAFQQHLTLDRYGAALLHELRAAVGARPAEPGRR